MGVNKKDGSLHAGSPTSKYGLDYRFMDLYESNQKRYGFVSDPAIARINQMIRQTDTQMNMKAMSFDAMAMTAGYALDQNMRIRKGAGLLSNDPVPEDVSVMMYQGPKASESELKDQSKDIRQEFYTQVKRCDHILTDQTRRVLGRDYQAFVSGSSVRRSCDDMRIQTDLAMDPDFSL